MRRAAGLLLCLLLAGCDTTFRETLISLEPLADWEADLAQARKSKDEYFRSAVDSPLGEEDLAGFRGLEYSSMNFCAKSSNVSACRAMRFS